MIKLSTHRRKGSIVVVTPFFIPKLMIVDSSESLCISLCEIKKEERGIIMKIYSCQSHIEQALDDLIIKEEVFPIMESIQDNEKLSTKCTYCEISALYVVANE